MTPDDCRRIIENLETIRHVANGGTVQFALHDCYGNFVRFERPNTKVLVRCLGNYRLVPIPPKPRIRVCAHCGTASCCAGRCA